MPVSKIVMKNARAAGEMLPSSTMSLIEAISRW
jgi:hypothetical protein